MLIIPKNQQFVIDPINPPPGDPFDTPRPNDPIDPTYPNDPSDPNNPIDPINPDEPTPMSMIKRIYPFLFVAKEERVEREISLYRRPHFSSEVTSPNYASQSLSQMSSSQNVTSVAQ